MVSSLVQLPDTKVICYVNQVWKHILLAFSTNPNNVSFDGSMYTSMLEFDMMKLMTGMVRYPPVEDDSLKEDISRLQWYRGANS
jgi:hypothetical protein